MRKHGLEEILESRGMSQAEFAERTGRPKKTINEIIRGKSGITPDTALQFERVLDIPASFWIAREQNYREALARTRQASFLQQEGDWLEQIPYRAMAKLGWISAHRDRCQQLDEVLRVFAVASPASWETFWSASVPAFRQSQAFKTEPGAIAAWLRKGEIETAKQECAEYSAGAFKAALTRIRALSRDLPRNFPAVMTRECNSAGVCLAFVPELPGTRVWGATRWLGTARPLIQLSLRYKTDDHLWFTFFHEAGHILLHSRKDVFLEDDQRRQVAKESEADEFARNWLIPADRYRAFCRLGAYTCAAASRFAYELGIAPGIIVGCLQHDNHLRRSECNELKKPIDWVFNED